MPDHPIDQQLRRKVEAAQACGLNAVTTRHAWGWSRWRVETSSVTRQAMYIKEPGLSGIRLQAAAALARPDLILNLDRPFMRTPIKINTLAPPAILIAALAWMVARLMSMSLHSGPWLTLLLLPMLALVVQVSTSRTALTAVVGPRLRIVDVRDVHFAHLSSAADLLDGIDASAQHRLHLDSNGELWSAASASSVRQDAAEKLARRAAAFADAARTADALALGNDVSPQTWNRLIDIALDDVDDSAHSSRMRRVAERLRLLDRSVAAESGIDSDRILAEAASSLAAAERVDDALARALQDTRTTHHVEGVVDKLVDCVSTPCSPIAEDTLEQIEAYRSEMTTRMTAAEAAITALYHVDQTSPSDSKENSSCPTQTAKADR